MKKRHWKELVRRDAEEHKDEYNEDGRRFDTIVDSTWNTHQRKLREAARELAAAAPAADAPASPPKPKKGSVFSHGGASVELGPGAPLTLRIASWLRERFVAGLLKARWVLMVLALSLIHI